MCSIGVKNDKSEGLNQGLVKGLNVLKNKQNFTAFEDDENDELQAIDANQGLHNDLSRTKNVVYIKH